MGVSDLSRHSGPSNHRPTVWLSCGWTRTSLVQEIWRGQAIFALVFAPLGTFVRFFASLFLNGVFVSFPLRISVVNVLGSSILGWPGTRSLPRSVLVLTTSVAAKLGVRCDK